MCVVPQLTTKVGNSCHVLKRVVQVAPCEQSTQVTRIRQYTYDEAILFGDGKVFVEAC
jgi:hypothetical protein